MGFRGSDHLPTRQASVEPHRDDGSLSATDDPSAGASNCRTPNPSSGWLTSAAMVGTMARGVFSAVGGQGSGVKEGQRILIGQLREALNAAVAERDVLVVDIFGLALREQEEEEEEQGQEVSLNSEPYTLNPNP
jgi:hypothetical protein